MLNSVWYRVHRHHLHVLQTTDITDIINNDTNHKNTYGRLPIILVHGLVVGATYMESLAEHLAAYTDVYIPELPGYGKSTIDKRKGTSPSIAEMADIIVSLMDSQLNIRQAVFIGNSLGCSIIVELCLRYPEHVSKCVLQGPIMGDNRRSLASQVMRLMWNGIYEPPSMGIIMAKDYYRCGFSHAYRSMRMTMEYRIEDKIRNITCPVLVVSSERDPVSPPEWCDSLAAVVNNHNAAHVMLEGAAHTANYSAVQQLTRVIVPFILHDKDQLVFSAHSHQQYQLLQREVRKQERISIWCYWIFLLLTLMFTATFPYCSGTTLVMVSLMAAAFLWWMMIAAHRIQIRKHRQLQRGISVHPYTIQFPIQHVAGFDSAIGMLRSLAQVLAANDFPSLGGIGFGMGRVIKCINFFPDSVRNMIYSWFGSLEASSCSTVTHTVRSEDICNTITLHYPIVPSIRKPVVAIGSSNGALLHLWAAMGVPWLPQTVLVPVRRPQSISYRNPNNNIPNNNINNNNNNKTIFQNQQQMVNDVIDLTAEMRWGEEIGRDLLENNPDWQLHHMADPNQDMLMIRYMSYFRMKLRRLSDSYQQFLFDTLAPNGTILIVDCTQTWPVCRVGDSHYFQSGAVGGIRDAGEYVEGSARTDEFIETMNSRDVDVSSTRERTMHQQQQEQHRHHLHQHHHSHHQKYTHHQQQQQQQHPHHSRHCHHGQYYNWNAPHPDATAPEAEWGFESTLKDDIRRFAARHGFRVERICFDGPGDASPFVADLYRKWYRDMEEEEEEDNNNNNNEQPSQYENQSLSSSQQQQQQQKKKEKKEKKRNGEDNDDVDGNRLLVESFILTEPFWTLRRRVVPYWTEFPVEPAAEHLERYLRRHASHGDAYRDAKAFLFSHGVKSIGIADVYRWRSLLTDHELFIHDGNNNNNIDNNNNNEPFLGVDTKRFPKDFGVNVSYHEAIAAAPGRMYKMPPTMEYEYVKEFLRRHKSKYNVCIVENDDDNNDYDENDVNEEK